MHAIMDTTQFRLTLSLSLLAACSSKKVVFNKY